MWKTSTTKSFEHFIVRFSFIPEETFKRCCIINNTSWETIYEKCSGEESLIPKGDGHARLSKE